MPCSSKPIALVIGASCRNAETSCVRTRAGAQAETVRLGSLRHPGWSRLYRCKLRGGSRLLVATMDRCGKGLGAGEGLTGKAITAGRKGLGAESCGMSSSNAAVSTAVQLVIKGSDFGRAAVVMERPAIAPGTQRPSRAGFSPKGQGLLHVLSG